MDPVTKFKQFLLAIGDVFVLYAALALALFIRYGTFSNSVMDLHFWPFTILFGFWLSIFYIGGMYELRDLKNDLNFAKRYVALVGAAGITAILLFYFIPVFIIAPKTNLFIFFIIAGLLDYIWRNTYNAFLSAGAPTTKVLLVGYNKTAQELADYVQENPQLGYEIAFWMKDGLQDKEFEHLSQIILNNKITAIVVPAHIKKQARAARLIYRHMMIGIEILDLADLYEKVFGKVPLEELEEVWFLENLAKSHVTYDFFKRPAELLFAFTIAIVVLPIALLIALVITLTSRGPVVYSQKRIGKHEHPFTIYKFRTMYVDAEKHGAQWAQKNDPRITPVGRFLRRTHLDELPQLFNVLNGNLSLVGPRPERPEFVDELKKDIPFYELRHITRPGVTGWAQINYRYGASVDEALEKLQYEIYYLKNRSIILDLLIIIKTIRYFFMQAK